MNMDKQNKIKDEDILMKMLEEKAKNEAYDFGTYTNYHGLDVKNLKNPHNF